MRTCLIKTHLRNCPDSHPAHIPLMIRGEAPQVPCGLGTQGAKGTGSLEEGALPLWDAGMHPTRRTATRRWPMGPAATMNLFARPALNHQALSTRLNITQKNCLSLQ